MQSKRMQNFQESSSVVTAYVKSICYNALENMKSAIRNQKSEMGGPYMSNSCAMVLSNQHPISRIKYRVSRSQSPVSIDFYRS